MMLDIRKMLFDYGYTPPTEEKDVLALVEKFIDGGHPIPDMVVNYAKAALEKAFPMYAFEIGGSFDGGTDLSIHVYNVEPGDSAKIMTFLYMLSHDPDLPGKPGRTFCLMDRSIKDTAQFYPTRLRKDLQPCSLCFGSGIHWYQDYRTGEDRKETCPKCAGECVLKA